MQEDYVVVDLEMTGLKSKTDRILEIGAVKVRGGRVVGEYHKMVDPRMELPEEIVSLTGITNEMAREGCGDAEAVFGFLEFAEGLPLVGHNILFDYSFLKQCAVNYGRALEKEGIDTLKLARKFLPKEEKKTLDCLCAYYGIERERNHRALEDARATAVLFRRLQEAFGESDPEAFQPKPLKRKVKKQTPATPRQKRYLKELAAYHKIELKVEIDSLTRSEASRMVDRILSACGKMAEEPKKDGADGETP